MTEVDSIERMYVGDGIYAIKSKSLLDERLLLQDGHGNSILMDSEVFQKVTSYAFYLWPDAQRRILRRITG